MARKKSFAVMLRAAARVVAKAREFGCSTTCSALSLHGVTFEQAAEMWMAGFRPHRWTSGDVIMTDRWRTYYDLQGQIDGVSVVLFTVDRPATTQEIAEEMPAATVAHADEPLAPTAPTLRREVVADAAPEPPRPVHHHQPESRWSCLEID